MIMAMKESGIEWVGLIPDDWKIAKNNRLFNISKQLVNENWKNTQLLSLTKSGIIEKNINERVRTKFVYLIGNANLGKIIDRKIYNMIILLLI